MASSARGATTRDGVIPHSWKQFGGQSIDKVIVSGSKRADGWLRWLSNSSATSRAHAELVAYAELSCGVAWRAATAARPPANKVVVPKLYTCAQCNEEGAVTRKTHRSLRRAQHSALSRSRSTRAPTSAARSALTCAQPRRQGPPPSARVSSSLSTATARLTSRTNRNVPVLMTHQFGTGRLNNNWHSKCMLPVNNVKCLLQVSNHSTRAIARDLDYRDTRLLHQTPASNIYVHSIHAYAHICILMTLKCRDLRERP